MVVYTAFLTMIRAIINAVYLIESGARILCVSSGIGSADIVLLKAIYLI